MRCGSTGWTELRSTTGRPSARRGDGPAGAGRDPGAGRPAVRTAGPLRRGLRDARGACWRGRSTPDARPRRSGSCSPRCVACSPLEVTWSRLSGFHRCGADARAAPDCSSDSSAAAAAASVLALVAGLVAWTSVYHYYAARVSFVLVPLAIVAGGTRREAHGARRVARGARDGGVRGARVAGAGRRERARAVAQLRRLRRQHGRADCSASS